MGLPNVRYLLIYLVNYDCEDNRYPFLTENTLSSKETYFKRQINFHAKIKERDNYLVQTKSLPSS